MSGEHETSDDELVGEIYQGLIEPKIGAKLRTDFQPWHKPRKHYIRIFQWCKETNLLLKGIGEDGQTIRYLGLPGEDFLDVRVLKGVCKSADATLHYLGFNESLMSARLNLSKHEINSDPYISEGSVVIGDPIEQIAEPDSMAYQYVRRHAPFHVVNLDLCGSVIHESQDGVRPLLEAVRAICDVQILKRTEPWLLFLTTRAIRDGMSAETLEKLFLQLERNMQANGDFEKLTLEKLGFDKSALQGELGKPGGLDTLNWVNAYVLAIAKWILGYMTDHAYKVSVSMLKSYRYSVHAGNPDMFSLAFRLEPGERNRVDRSGLTRESQRQARSANELAMAIDLVSKIAQMGDIDEILASDKDLLKKVYEKSSRLLESIGYDKNEYKRFAAVDS